MQHLIELFCKSSSCTTHIFMRILNPAVYAKHNWFSGCAKTNALSALLIDIVIILTPAIPSAGTTNCHWQSAQSNKASVCLSVCGSHNLSGNVVGVSSFGSRFRIVVGGCTVCAKHHQNLTTDPGLFLCIQYCVKVAGCGGNN
jgi:hypothetical protein